MFLNVPATYKSRHFIPCEYSQINMQLWQLTSNVYWLRIMAYSCLTLTHSHVIFLLSLRIQNLPSNINMLAILLLLLLLALQADIYSVQHWCAENHIELDIQKKKIISFTCETNSVHFNYYDSNEIILRSDCIKDLGVML
jgi:hypothetical protein